MGVTKYTIERGSGDFPTDNDVVEVKHSCYFDNNTNEKGYYKGDQVVIKGDTGELEFRIGDGIVTKGFNEGVSRMKLGENCALIIPSNDAYGKSIVRLMRINDSTWKPNAEGDLPETVLYGCTFEGCFHLFTREKSWSYHEANKHSISEHWWCPATDQSGEKCKKLFEWRHSLENHLKISHGENPREFDLKIYYFGGDYHSRFWCGFCKTSYPQTKEGFDARTERNRHVGNYFRDGRHIMEWVEVGGQLPNWNNAPDGVYLVDGFGAFECAIFQNGLISRAQAIKC
ncbi:putative peptidylprolyl isomerase [Microsporum audouinii]